MFGHSMAQITIRFISVMSDLRLHHYSSSPSSRAALIACNRFFTPSLE